MNLGNLGVPFPANGPQVPPAYKQLSLPPSHLQAPSMFSPGDRPSSASSDRWLGPAEAPAQPSPPPTLCTCQPVSQAAGSGLTPRGIRAVQCTMAGIETPPGPATPDPYPALFLLQNTPRIASDPPKCHCPSRNRSPSSTCHQPMLPLTVRRCWGHWCEVGPGFVWEETDLQVRPSHSRPFTQTGGVAPARPHPSPGPTPSPKAWGW